MKANEFWQNFNLGIELAISGSFIYNGLKNFDEMKNFHNTHEVFEFLYSTSVGLERLMKISIILIEHNDSTDQDTLEQSLLNHNHLELMNRIKKHYDLNLGTLHNEFLHLCTNFYKTMRYDRYILQNYRNYDQEKFSLVNFIEKYLKIVISLEYFNLTKNSFRIKKFIGNLIGKICESLFDIIKKEASKKNLYTYELDYTSKASKIFLHKKYNFFEETVLWKELIIFLMNTKLKNPRIDKIKEIKPLEFDIALLGDYFACFHSEVDKLGCMDELDFHYESIVNKKERFEILELLNDQDFLLDYDEEEEIKNFNPEE